MKDGLFPELPRYIKPRRIMMHCIDGGVAKTGGDAVHWKCKKCGLDEWAEYEGVLSITEIYRGEPCPKCNTRENLKRRHPV